MEFILNGEDVSVDSDSESRLVDILRENFGLSGTKPGCYTGKCGSCLVILNGNVVKACLVPAFRIKDGEIITIEGFSQTDEYQDIIQGFSEAGLENCGFCNTGKILATETLLARKLQPSKTEILSAFYDIRCRCTAPDELVQGVMAVGKFRRQRLYGLS